MSEHIEDVDNVPSSYKSGTLLVVRGGLGIPSIVRVKPDGSWVCIAGMFKGRSILNSKKVLRVCEDGDIFEDLGLIVRNGALVPMETNP